MTHSGPVSPLGFFATIGPTGQIEVCGHRRLCHQFGLRGCGQSSNVSRAGPAWAVHSRVEQGASGSLLRDPLLTPGLGCSHYWCSQLSEKWMSLPPFLPWFTLGGLCHYLLWVGAWHLEGNIWSVLVG